MNNSFAAFFNTLGNAGINSSQPVQSGGQPPKVTGAAFDTFLSDASASSKVDNSITVNGLLSGLLISSPDKDDAPAELSNFTASLIANEAGKTVAAPELLASIEKEAAVKAVSKLLADPVLNENSELTTNVSTIGGTPIEEFAPALDSYGKNLEASTAKQIVIELQAMNAQEIIKGSTAKHEFESIPVNSPEKFIEVEIPLSEIVNPKKSTFVFDAQVVGAVNPENKVSDTDGKKNSQASTSTQSGKLILDTQQLAGFLKTVQNEITKSSNTEKPAENSIIQVAETETSLEKVIAPKNPIESDNPLSISKTPTDLLKSVVKSKSDNLKEIAANFTQSIRNFVTNTTNQVQKSAIDESEFVVPSENSTIISQAGSTAVNFEQITKTPDSEEAVDELGQVIQVNQINKGEIIQPIKEIVIESVELGDKVVKVVVGNDALAKAIEQTQKSENREVVFEKEAQTENDPKPKVGKVTVPVDNTDSKVSSDLMKKLSMKAIDPNEKIDIKIPAKIQIFDRASASENASLKEQNTSNREAVSSSTDGLTKVFESEVKLEVNSGPKVVGQQRSFTENVNADIDNTQNQKAESSTREFQGIKPVFSEAKAESPQVSSSTTQKQMSYDSNSLIEKITSKLPEDVKSEMKFAKIEVSISAESEEDLVALNKAATSMESMTTIEGIKKLDDGVVKNILGFTDHSNAETVNSKQKVQAESQFTSNKPLPKTEIIVAVLNDIKSAADSKNISYEKIDDVLVPILDKKETATVVNKEIVTELPDEKVVSKPDTFIASKIEPVKSETPGLDKIFKSSPEISQVNTLSKKQPSSGKMSEFNVQKSTPQEMRPAQDTSRPAQSVPSPAQSVPSPAQNTFDKLSIEAVDRTPAMAPKIEAVHVADEKITIRIPVQSDNGLFSAVKVDAVVEEAAPQRTETLELSSEESAKGRSNVLNPAPTVISKIKNPALAKSTVLEFRENDNNNVKSEGVFIADSNVDDGGGDEMLMTDKSSDMRSFDMKDGFVSSNGNSGSSENGFQNSGQNGKEDFLNGHKAEKDETNDISGEKEITTRTKFESRLLEVDGKTATGFLKMDSKELVNKITRFAKFSLDKKGTEMKIQLEPEHLGKMAMKLQVENQKLMASIQVETTEAKAMLQENLNILKDSLADQGVEIQKFDVFVQQDNFQQNLNNSKSSEFERDLNGNNTESGSGKIAGSGDTQKIESRPTRKFGYNSLELVA